METNLTHKELFVIFLFDSAQGLPHHKSWCESVVQLEINEFPHTTASRVTRHELIDVVCICFLVDLA